MHFRCIWRLLFVSEKARASENLIAARLLSAIDDNSGIEPGPFAHEKNVRLDRPNFRWASQRILVKMSFSRITRFTFELDRNLVKFLLKIQPIFFAITRLSAWSTSGMYEMKKKYSLLLDLFIKAHEILQRVSRQQSYQSREYAEFWSKRVSRITRVTFQLNRSLGKFFPKIQQIVLITRLSAYEMKEWPIIARFIHHKGHEILQQGKILSSRRRFGIPVRKGLDVVGSKVTSMTSRTEKSGRSLIESMKRASIRKQTRACRVARNSVYIDVVRTSPTRPNRAVFRIDFREKKKEF